MKSCILVVLVFLATSAFAARQFTKCKANTRCTPSGKCQREAEDGANTKQVCGNDGKSYALSCIACAQNCNKKTFKWKDGVCGIPGQKVSPTELFGGNSDKPKHSGKPEKKDQPDKLGYFGHPKQSKNLNRGPSFADEALLDQLPGRTRFTM